jgi:hypothetical protein
MQGGDVVLARCSSDSAVTAPCGRGSLEVVARVALFVYVLIILAPFSFVPLFPSVDNTWEFALNWGAAHGLALGRDLIWTTGPLWYLAFPLDIGNNLSQGLTFQWAEWIVLAAIFADLFFVCGFALGNLAAFTVFFGLSAPLYAASSGPENRLAAAALVLLIGARWRGGRFRYLAALVLAGLVPLIKLTGGILVGGAILGFVAEGVCRRRLKAWPEVALAAAVPAGVAVVVCLMTMPSAGSLVQYLKGSWEVTSGYNAAMSIVGGVSDLGGAGLMLVWIGVLLYVAARANAALGRFFALLLPLPLFLSFKHSFVRQDGHVVNFFCFAGLALGLISLAMSMEGRRTGVLLAMLGLYGITWFEYVPGPGAFAMVDGVDEMERVWQALDPGKLRGTLRASSEAAYPAEKRLEPELRAIVGDASVGEMSLIYSSALLDRLNLKLFPVVQRYTAYTSDLDRLNAAWMRDLGPRFLIADWEAIDGRNPYAETPAMWLEAYRWYDARKMGSRHLLLERREKARFSELRPVLKFDAPLDLAIELTTDKTPEFWSLSCGYRTVGWLRKVLLRVAPVTMFVDGESAGRVPVEVLSSPMMWNPMPSSLAELGELFEASSVPRKMASVSFDGPGVVNYGPVCQVQTFAAR